MRTKHYDKSNAELPLTPNLLPLTGFVMWSSSDYVLVPWRREAAKLFAHVIMT